MPEHTMTLVLKSTLSELETLHGKLAQFGKTARLSAKTIYHINLVLDELFTNIVTYGQKEEAECHARICLSEDHKTLTLHMEDCGIPFNPVEAEAPDLQSGLEERAIGGMGIHIVKNIMDDIKYERKGDKNILTLTKRLP